ncbi:MAG: gliding motility-associated C-terminal domain-containing protein [Chitinophagales bacterium]
MLKANMMHLRLLTITCLSLFFLQIDSFAQIRQNIYGGNGVENINAIIPSPSGGYVLCGSTTSSGAGEADVLVMEIDNNGTIIWANTYGGVNDDIGFDITPANDGGYAIVASSKSVTPFNEQAYVLKIEADGTIDWQKFIGNDNSTEKFYTILQVSLNGYLVGGSLQSGNNPPNAFIGKLRFNGQSFIWSKALGNTGFEAIHDLQLKADGTVVATGVESSFTGNQENMLVLDIDEADNGNILRALSIGGGNQDIAYRNVLTNDGGYLLYGKTLSCGGTTFNEVAVKLDAAGAISWTKTFGSANDDNIVDAVELSNGDYAFASFYRVGNSLDLQLTQTDNQGNILNAYYFGSEGDERVLNVESSKKMLVTPTGIIMATSTDGFTANARDLYLLQTDLPNNDDCNSIVININSSDCNFSNTAINPNVSNIPLPILQDIFISPVSASLEQKSVCCDIEAEATQNPLSVCEGQSVQLEVDALNANGSITYNWSPTADLDNSTAPMPQASPTVNTNYFVTVTDNAGCTATASMAVEILAAPILELGEPIEECVGITSILGTNESFDSYLWQDGTATSTLAVTVSGTYALTVTNATTGCTAMDEIEVTFIETNNPTIDLGMGADTLKICEGENIVLDAGEGFTSYLWSDASTSSQLTVDEAGTYEVTVFSFCGSGSDSVVVEVESCDEPDSNQQRIIVPTAFSPNGDGVNDKVQVLYNQGVELVKFAIYNRSGEPVFETANPFEGWDGIFKNDEQNVGIYVYYLEAVDTENRNKPILLRGNITLIR